MAVRVVLRGYTEAMPPPDTTLIGTFPSSFWLLGEILFRWVPSVISVVTTDVSGTTSPYKNFTEPLSIFSVPKILSQTAAPGVYHGLGQAWYIFSLITLIASIPFIGLILYCWIRIVQIRRFERRQFEAARRTVASQNIPSTQLRWNRVLEQMNAGTPEGSRLAVLEADIMLNELLDLQGYKGETMADKMKQVDRAKFNTIDLAWEAHKIRDIIAHEGVTSDLAPREARRVISLYEKVFREFRFIE